MKKTRLLIAILDTGERLEAEISIWDNLDQAKKNMSVNYSLPAGSVVDWMIEE